MKIKLFADTASLKDIADLYHLGTVAGFTTNPTLMRRAGVTDYADFAKTLLNLVRDLPVSFEVFADDPEGMLREAEVIASWGPNVYVKIPITTTSGQSTVPLIGTLLAKGIKVNVTAIVDISVLVDLVPILGTTPAIVSVFAGRIADTGRDPCHYMSLAHHILDGIPMTELLWASTREVWNIMQAEKVHCDIITVTPDILAKLGGLGRNLCDLSLATVKQFHTDATASAYTLEGGSK